MGQKFPRAEEEILLTIVAEIDKLNDNQTEADVLKQQAVQLEEVIQPKVPRLFDLECEFDETREPHLENSQEGLNRYRCEKVRLDTGSSDIGPLKWWKANEGSFPGFSILARRYLAIPATSATAERLFSRLGLIFRDNRMALLPTNANMILFCHVNSHLPLVKK